MHMRHGSIYHTSKYRQPVLRIYTGVFSAIVHKSGLHLDRYACIIFSHTPFCFCCAICVIWCGKLQRVYV